MNDQPTNDHMDEAGVPMSDAEEMELRGRMTMLEDRVGLAFWLAISAEVGVLALALILLFDAWRNRT
jgi:hypothetical protein